MAWIEIIFGIYFMLTWASIDVPFMKLTGYLGLAVMVFRLYLQIRSAYEESKFRRQEDTSHWEDMRFPDIRLCPYCSQPVEKGYKFCSECGRKLPGGSDKIVWEQKQNQ